MALVVAIGVSAATVSAQDATPRQTIKQLRLLKDTAKTKRFWARASKPRRVAGKKVAVHARKFRSVKLDTPRLRSVLARAPQERTAAARTNPLVVSLPAPNGAFHRFALQRSADHGSGPREAPSGDQDLQRPRHHRPDGDDPRRRDARSGFHASVRSASGSWYIDPFYVGRNPSAYASYYARDAKDTNGSFVERDADSAELSVDEGYYHAADTVEVDGHGFAENAAITITISDPEERFASRTRARDLGRARRLRGELRRRSRRQPRHAHRRGERRQTPRPRRATRSSATTTRRRDPPTGEQLRTYRLAMITDPGYAAFHGGSANVTAAKVALMNRVSQVYEDDLTIRLQLIASNDLLNLDTWEQAIAPNGPCGAAGCFTQSQVTGCSSTTRARFVIGQIIGASNYDIGHLALGQPGGGVANLGVVGRSNKAGGCTGIPTPVGDFYAVDYVAHEMGHQFAGNHTFNGNQLNCSGGNRSAVDLGRAGQRLVGHGLRGHLPHRRPAAAQRPVLLAAEPAGDGRRTSTRPRRRSTRCRPCRCGTSAAATRSRS